MNQNKFMLTISALIMSLLIIAGLSFTHKSNPTIHTQLPNATNTTISSAFLEAIDYAQQNLKHSGKLIRKSDGYVYLQVENEYIYKLFPMLGLKKEGFREVSFSRSRDSPGAHISVFYSDEKVNPQEIGETFHFELKKIEIIKTSKNTSYVVLEVESPELENLRKKYGFNAKLHGHEFHISLGKKIIKWIRNPNNNALIKTQPFFDKKK